MEKEIDLKITKTELIALYESVLYYSEEAEIPEKLEKNVEVLLNLLESYLRKFL